MRVLIAESSENTAFEIDSLLRDAGYATRTDVTDDLGAVSQSLASGGADILFLSAALPDAEHFLPRLRERSASLPIILLAKEEELKDAGKMMAMGATDLVSIESLDHLAQVSKREIEHVCERTQQVALRRALQEAEQRCQLLLQGSSTAIAYVHEGMHIYANKTYVQTFGFSEADDVLGVPIMDVVAAESADEFKAGLKAMRGEQESFESEFKGQSQDGEPVAGQLTLAHAMYEGEECLQVTIKFGEEQPPAAEAAPAPAPEPEANGASVDGFNLETFTSVVQASLESAQEGCAYVAVCRLANKETLLKEHGIIGLERIASKTMQILREQLDNKPLARLSQTEFAFATFEHSAKDIEVFLNALCQSVTDSNFEVEEKTVKLHLKGACVQMEERARSALNNAYEAAVDADTAGIVVHRPTSGDPELDEANRVLATINQAIEKETFKLLFQPIISLRGDSDEHYEVFLRMMDEDGKEHAPDHFLATAIEQKVAGKIDRWVILQSIKMLSLHRAKGHTTRLTINITSNSVCDTEFVQWLTVAIKAARLPSDAVIFQLSEHDALTYVRQTKEFVTGLQQMHCRASINRFGTNDDSMELLNQVPVEFVKLDGSLVPSLGSEKDALTPVLQQLQSKGKLTVVPMVESANALSSLWQAGANYIQGHYLQEPSSSMDYDFSTEDD